jgi:hypothetical protein
MLMNLDTQCTIIGDGGNKLWQGYDIRIETVEAIATSG